MASVASFHGLLHFKLNLKSRRSNFRVRAQSLGDGDSMVLSNESVANGYSLTTKEAENGSLINECIIREREDKSSEVKIDEGNEKLKYREERKLVKNLASEELEVLWDDGYGEKTIKDYLIEAKEMIKPDGGPPRWFCPIECGQPLKDAPLLLFLPGLDGVGLGLILHHKALGRVFEVRCLHIPVFDRTPFEGLLKFVEETVRVEHAASPNKPIYLVGDSFGGSLAFAVAARNPNIDLVLILANPATSFGRSQLQPFFPILEAMPDEMHAVVPYLLSFVMGNPLKMATVDIEYQLPYSVKMEQLSKNLTSLLPSLSILSDIITKSALLWKLKLLKFAAAYTNSRLHAVRAEVLVLASGRDYMLPSEEEAKRLKNSLKNCTVRVFKDNGHTLLMEDDFQLLTVIKGTTKYRRTNRLDPVADFLPPSMSEVKRGFDEIVGLLSFAFGASMYSTLDDGRIVRGLAGVPDKGPVLLVGYHMLMGLEVYPLVEEFLKQKKIMVRGVAHPVIFNSNMKIMSPEFSIGDWMKVMGAIPVSPSNLFKLLSTNSHVVLYPGGVREALHFRGEAYKVIWPDQPEFIRMAARFGATIVPFGAVGEDDIGELVLDYNDLMRIPIINDLVRDAASGAKRIRDQSQGEVANQELYVPGILPKLPGRFYYLFGKPIQTKGQEDLLRNRDKSKELYLEVQSEVRRNIAYLLKKREEDPYRNIVDRTMYRALYSSSEEVPAFET